jgi:hypothetical protein
METPKECPQPTILAFEGESRFFWFDGITLSTKRTKGTRLGAEAAQPQRIYYRQLTH